MRRPKQRPENASQRPLRNRLGRPGRRSAAQHGHTATSAHAQVIYPWQAQVSLGGRGPLVGRHDHGGSFSYDPWELYRTGHLHSPNILILGSLGYGKSSLAKTYSVRSRLLGRRIEVIDRKSEYAPVIEAMGGKMLRLERGVCINPLSRLGTQASRESLLRATVRVLLGRQLQPVERVGLTAALAAVDARHSDREVVIPDLVQELRSPSLDFASTMNLRRVDVLERMAECCYALMDLSMGPLAGLFDGLTTHGNEFFNLPALGIDISGIAAQLYGADEDMALAIALTCLTAYLDAKHAERAREAEAAGRSAEKLIRLSDEAWRAIAVEGAAQFYAASLKLSRSTGIQHVLALHRLSDLSATGDAGTRQQQLAEGLVSECSTRIVYHQPPGEVDETAHLLNLTSTERDLLTTLAQGQALWKVGPRSFVVKHELTAAEDPLIRTDKAMADRGAIV